MRHFASPKHALAPMNAEQRAWCATEIERYQPDLLPHDLAHLADDALARLVLKSWARSVRF
ncbi:hypothetical protein HZU75_14340 [Chitinibacter fontanus]|uniref:Uncharacterized protein n=1 Tax=Chitinibacter fontanus TaxID=1737446 RepID=A0A7D5ZM66_9NEIS|nr:hypothetical protein [Chitinibacter fontanus]QLI82610.1 hypothetical protein HZU75_14340 [Chitinibacter fontanus]